MRKAETANKVKMLSKSIKPSDQWMKTRCRIMKDLLIEKFKQVEPFRTALLATDNKPLAHDVVNLFWGTGRSFKGENMFGKLLMEVRDQARAQMCKLTLFMFVLRFTCISYLLSDKRSTFWLCLAHPIQGLM